MRIDSFGVDEHPSESFLILRYGNRVTTVGLVVMATGLYKDFLPGLIQSAELHVQGLHDIFVLSDAPPDVKSPVSWLPWGHFDWPLPTLLRFRAITNYSSQLANCDVLLYVDADMLFVDEVDVRNSDGLVAVFHPGYSKGPHEEFPFESRPQSSFSLQATPVSSYFCGGVQGGHASEYLRAAEILADRIEQDLNRGVMPIWHDESAWNWWCNTFPPTMVLSSDYCTPDTWDISKARIVAITKDHRYLDGSRKQSMVKSVMNSISQMRKRFPV